MQKLFTLFVIFLYCTPLKAQNYPPPVAYWNFNGNTKDKSGNGWDANVYGCTLTTGKSGLPNTAYYFNGQGNHMQVPHKQGMNLQTWTIMALIKPQGLYSGNCQVTMITERGLTSSGSNHIFCINDNPYDNDCSIFSPDKAVFVAGPAGNANVDFKNGLFVDTTNTWYCVAATYGNDSIKLYVNGTLIQNSYWPDQYGSDIVDSLHIGCGTLMATYPNWFKGIMDQINIFDYVLTPDQINTACTNAGKDTGTVWTAIGDPDPTWTPVNDLNAKAISVYPNPASNIIHFTLDATWSGATASISNMMGQVLSIRNVSEKENQLDISNLPSGIYILKVSSGNKIATTRFIKERNQ